MGAWVLVDEIEVKIVDHKDKNFKKCRAFEITWMVFGLVISTNLATYIHQQDSYVWFNEQIHKYV